MGYGQPPPWPFKPWTLSRMRISIFKVMSVYLIDRYQNALPRATYAHDTWSSENALHERFQMTKCHERTSSENALHERFITEQWR